MSPYIISSLLLTICFTLATVVQSRLAQDSNAHAGNDLLALFFGDTRRMLANHFFTKADVYFHSGYYPSIFDQGGGERNISHLTGGGDHAGHDDHEHGEHCNHGEHEHDAHGEPAERGEPAHSEDEHEREMNFLGKPRDWVDAFGRNFYLTEHTELGGGKEREILPWLKIAAELDPQQVENYTVASYWLRKHLGKPADAEKFLREGQRANPESYEILAELGQLYAENFQDQPRARLVLELALKKWQQQNEGKPEPDIWSKRPILLSLARIEEQTGNFEKAIAYLELLKQISPATQSLQEQIDDLETKAASREP